MQIFELFGKILLKDDGIESKLENIDKKAGNTSSSMGLSFGKIAGVALKLGGIIGAGMGIKDMIDKASAGQQRMAQMEAVLKSTGGVAGMTKDELVKLADAQGKLTTFSKGTNIESENLLLTFTNIGQKIFPDALKTVNDMSQALGQDTKSSCIQLGKALNDPTKGITALSRVGVSFTAQQKDQIKAMEKAGDTAGAQKIILSELSREFGGSAVNAGKTFSGQMTILKNQIGSVSGSLGSVLIPYLTDFVTKINRFMPQIKQVITDVIDMVVPKFKEWIGLLGQIVSELLPKFGDTSVDAKGKIKEFSGVLDIVTGILKWMKDNIGIVKDAIVAVTAVWLIQKGVLIAHNIQLGIQKAMQIEKLIRDKSETGYIIALYTAEAIHNGVIKAMTVAQWLLNAAMDANPVGLVIAGITALIAIGILLYKNWDTISAFLLKCWNGIKSVAESVFNGLKSFFVSIFEAVGDLFTKAVTAWKLVITTAFDIIKSTIENIWNGIKTTTSNIFKGIENTIKGSIDNIKNFFGGIGNWFKDKFNSLFKFTFPHIPLPHFKLEGSFSLLPPKVPKLGIDWYAKGTDNFAGGLAGINEAGGEIVNLPSGSQIIPHDISKLMAQNSQRNQQPIIVITQLDGKEVARTIVDPMMEQIESKRKSRNLALGGSY
jgi:phage-related protein